MKKIYYLPEGTLLQGKYYIQDVIGEGGFGITYKAFDGVLKRQVAKLFLSSECRDDFPGKYSNVS